PRVLVVAALVSDEARRMAGKVEDSKVTGCRAGRKAESCRHACSTHSDECLSAIQGPVHVCISSDRQRLRALLILIAIQKHSRQRIFAARRCAARTEPNGYYPRRCASQARSGPGVSSPLSEGSPCAVGDPA